MPGDESVIFTSKDLFREITPPRKEDVLFRADPGDARHNVWLNYTDPEFLYSWSYGDAARCLTAHLLNSDTARKASLILPILYLWRHHIELTLKRLARTAIFLLDEDLRKDGRDALNQHRLDLIWKVARPLLEDARDKLGWTEPITEDLDGIESYIDQMTKFDRSGEGLRYPTSKDGEPALSYAKQINIAVFAERINCLTDFLDHIDSGYDGAAGWKSESYT